ncbi:uncharacterized protein JCM10292_004292 [Rhodotorula paludigena]|uniref:uncharacterized protein n=1 Tax=Rhodotorula paludigena TaxID=86838 RepID=UPI003179D2C5
MAPLSRPAILSLVSLTLHFSVLSIVLHISRTTTAPGARYHASSAIFLTELGKILVSFVLVVASGELRTAVRERHRVRELLRVQHDEIREREEDEARRKRIEKEEEEDGWLPVSATASNGIASGSALAREEKQSLLNGSGHGDRAVADADGFREATVVPVHRRTPSLEPSTPSPTRTRPSSSLSISVALANARNPSATPSLALIPATPVPDPSPTRPPDEASLYPLRPAGAQPAEAPDSVMDDLNDWEWWRTLKASVFGEGVWKLGVLAALFCFQGNAQYVASGNLSVPIFQLAYQLKIPATAMCSVILLNRSLSRQQWLALFILTFGVGIVQVFSASTAQEPVEATEAKDASGLDALHAHSEAAPNQALGLTAVVAACMSSGFASVYFERILKSPSSNNSSPHSSPNPSSYSSTLQPTLPSAQQPLLPSQPDAFSMPDPDKIVPAGKPSLWIRNIQLSMFGLVVGLPVVLWELRGCLGALDYEYLDQGWWSRAEYVARSAVGGFFDGFDRPLPWIVVALQITGGLLSALVMQHADNLLKCFSTSLSIVLSVAASVALFHFKLSIGIVLGAILVLGATFAYTSPSAMSSWRWRPVSMLPSGFGTR